MFKLEIGIPSVLSGLPRHPIFEDLSDGFCVTKHLLHKGILVPKLIDPGKMFTGPLPDISCMVNELIAHLHFGVLEPKSNVFEVNGDGSLEYGPSSFEFMDACLPLSILHPGSHVVLLSTE